MAGLIRALLGGGRGRGGRGGGGGGGLFGRRRRARRGGGGGYSGGGYSGGGGGGGYSGGGGRYIDNMQSMRASDGMQYGGQMGGMSSGGGMVCGPNGCFRAGSMPMPGAMTTTAGTAVTTTQPALPTAGQAAFNGNPVQTALSQLGALPGLTVAPPPHTAPAAKQTATDAAPVPGWMEARQRQLDSMRSEVTVLEHMARTGLYPDGTPVPLTQRDWTSAQHRQAVQSLRAAELAYAETLRQREDAQGPRALQQRLLGLQEESLRLDNEAKRARNAAGQLATDPARQAEEMNRIRDEPVSAVHRATALALKELPAGVTDPAAYLGSPLGVETVRGHIISTHGYDWAKGVHAAMTSGDRRPPEQSAAWQAFHRRYTAPMPLYEGDKRVEKSWLEQNGKSHSKMLNDAMETFGPQLRGRLTEEGLSYEDASRRAGAIVKGYVDRWFQLDSNGGRPPDAVRAPANSSDSPAPVPAPRPASPAPALPPFQQGFRRPAAPVQ